MENEEEAPSLPTRRTHITEDVGQFAVSVGFVDGHAVEVFISKRAKTGTGLDDILYELGVTVSKIMQGE